MNEPPMLNGGTHEHRVVVAESNPRVRSALILVLSQQRVISVVGECATLENLVDYLAETRATLLLLDWSMAPPDADHLVRDIHARCPGIIIIALSARPELHRQTLCAGVEAFVSKVDAPSSLLTAVTDTITRREHTAC